MVAVTTFAACNPLPSRSGTRSEEAPTRLHSAAVLGDRAAMDEQGLGGAAPALGLLERSDVMSELDGLLAGLATAGG
jgi:hypothetical protein